MIDIQRMLRTDLNLLLCLYVLLEERSVSKTADRLFITQSAVSKQLTRLRIVFDDLLFERSSHGLTPTPRAIGIQPALHKILIELDRLTLPDTFDANTSERVFNIDLVETAYQLIYARFMPHALSQAPAITINSATWGKESIKRLLNREVDFGIGIFEWDERARAHVNSIPAELNYVELRKDHCVCIMRRGHPALEEEWNLETFLKYRHVQVTTGGINEWLLQEVLHTKGLAIRNALNLSELQSAVELCKQSDLLMYYPLDSIKNYTLDGSLVIKPLPIALTPGAHLLLWHKYFESDPSHTWLRELIIAQFMP